MTPFDDLRVLVVDTDDETREATERALSASDTPGPAVTVETATTVDAAIDRFGSATPDCVVTEYDLPEESGLALVEWVRENAPDVPCILYTAATPDSIQTAAFEDVVVEYLPKNIPESEEALSRLVGNVVAQRSQIAYPLPDSESERLAAIEQYDVVGMEAQKAVDRITELVAAHFDVAVAFAGIVDAHEERFLSCHGADWDRLDRQDSICTHTLLEEDYLVVENVQADTRFSGVERLEELDIRSYAGVPLTTPGGLPIGALCLIHDEPRSYSEDELDHLQLFADELMEQLELRRRLSEGSATTGAEQ